MIINQYRIKAHKAITNGDRIALLVAAENHTEFDTVKHMTWFVGAVAEKIADMDSRRSTGGGQ